MRNALMARHPVRARRLAAQLAGFRRGESGSMAVLSVFIFVAMILFGGLAVDLMRHENERLRMQGVADRAVLAATMLRDNASGATPEQILHAYFAAEGLDEQLGDNFSVVDDEDGGRTVTVAPAATVPSLFMRLVGVNDFAVATPARAHETLGAGLKLEIVMVLDVSGSMNGQQKIGMMQTAATQLVNSLLTDDIEPGDVAITMVPYDTWVLPPAGFLNQFTNLQGSGACNDWTLWNSVVNGLTQSSQRRNCNTASWRTVRPYLSNAATAETYITELRASGTTSIDLGIRYGALFFDPSLRPAISALIANGDIDPVFEGRPYDWNEPNVVRALILLTDGENCCGERYSDGIQDTNSTATCDALKDQGILIYSIAYQAPPAGAALMQSCASSASHYFNTTADGIVDVFQGIANSVQTQALRLTL
ncbi:TadE/TadG family type IV pilus assembly protein [Pararhodobacter zhoushanensis]|uniref:TadE/TadG family type IV pilus assembly protein n=1 Tax=Pararhodobacter zhoushanensis TaxID=2479545 RepID=UPI000F8C882C|nr:TadE/TadG family type IV pilus assembly protein [Pararhodobacter zhoushanensis]